MNTSNTRRTSAAEPSIAVGDLVEVRSSLGTWARGFQVARISRAAYFVRRRSDHQLLPTAFPRDALRT